MSLINKQFDVNETRVFILAGAKQNDNDNDDDSDDDGVVTVVKPQIGVLFFLCFCVEKRNYVNEHLNSGHEFYPRLNCQKPGGMKRETKTIIKIAFSGDFSLVKKVTIFVLGIVSKNIFP